MKKYVITGASGGIGSAVKAKLEAEGAQVFNIDIKDSDLSVNLASDIGRKEAIETIHELFPDGIDGLVCCAGVSGACGDLKLIISLNYYGAVAMAEGCFDLLAKKKGSCVLLSSFSISQGYTMKNMVNTLLNEGSEPQVLDMIDAIDKSKKLLAGQAVYETSKYATILWMRRHAALWGAARVNINCVAPGTTQTGMVSGMNDIALMALNAIQMPIKYEESLMLDADEVAEPICFLLSDKAKAIHSVNLFVDGGCEAAINTEHVY